MDRLIGVVAPHECISCTSEGKILCDVCTSSLPKSQPCCYRCRKPSVGGFTCAECINKTNIDQVQVATIYQAIPKHLIWSLKMSGAKPAASIIARCMKSQFLINSQAIIIPVPTATSRARQRGYDQAKLIAKQLSNQTGLKYSNNLARSGQMHQHGLTRHDRLTQLQGAYRVTDSTKLKNKHIVLVDDVITTGATLEAAALALEAAGVIRITAMIFARPEINTTNNKQTATL